MKIGFKLLLRLSQCLAVSLLCCVTGKSSFSDTAKELQISAQEIRLDGTIRELRTSAPHIMLNAISFTLPNGKSQKFATPKSKPVMVDTQCWIHAQSELDVRLKLSDLKLGETIIVIGRDGGSGLPLQGREIIVQRNTSDKTSHGPARNRVVNPPDENEDLPTQPQLVAQIGHPNIILCAAVSPTGEFFATGDSQGGVKIWSMDTGELYADLPGHYGLRNHIRSMTFSPDGRYLATGADIGAAKLWHVATGKFVRNLRLGGAIYGLDFAPKKSPLYSDKELPLVVASYTEGTKIVNALTGDVMQNIRSTNPEALSGKALFSPDGTYLAHELNTGHIEIWDTVTEKVITSIPHQMGGIMAMAFSPDGKLLATSSYDRNMKLWDVASGRELVRFPQQPGFMNLNTLCFSPDGDALWSPYHQGIQSWDLRSAFAGTPTSVPVDLKANNVALLSPAYVVITRFNGTEVRKTSDLEVVCETDGMAAIVEKMELSSDGRYIATGGFGSFLHVWDVAQGVLTWSGSASTPDFAFSPNSKSIATINFFPPDGDNLTVWALPAGKFHNDFPLTGSHVTCSAGGLIAVGNDKGHVKLFDSEKRKVLKDLPDGKETTNIRQIAFSPDGSILARNYVYKTEIEIWNPRKGEQIQSIKCDTAINAFAFSPDGKTLVTISDDPGMKFWNVQSGEMGTQFKTDSPVKAVTFSPDGLLLAGILANENKVQIWDIKTGETRNTLQDEYALSDIEFSLDGKSFVTASRYGFIRLWDIANGNWKVTLRTLANMSSSGPSEWIAYTPEGYYTGSENIDSKLRWRVGRNLQPASSQKAAMYQPTKVQAALASLVGPKSVPQPKAKIENVTPEKTVGDNLVAEKSAAEKSVDEPAAPAKTP